MSPFKNGFLSFMFKYADIGTNFSRPYGHGDVTRAYSDYARYSRMLAQPGISGFHKDNVMKRIQAAEEILQKNLKGSDWKTLYKGRVSKPVASPPAVPPASSPAVPKGGPNASKLFGRFSKGIGRYGRGAAIAGGLGLGAAYLLGRNKKPEQVQPVYGPMPSPHAAAGYY